MKSTEPLTQNITSSYTQEINKANSSNKNTQLVEIIETKEKSIFKILKWADKYYLTLGKYRLTEAMETEEEANDQVFNVTWERILQVMHIVVHEEIKADKLGKSITNQ